MPFFQRVFYLGMLSFLLFFPGVIRAQQPEAPKRIPAAQLQADFAVLRQAYETLHPGLYHYRSKVQMDAEFATLQAALNHDLTLAEAYLAISRFLTQIKCGHTYANFFNQPKAVANLLFKNPNRVPFYFRWIDRRMIVTRNFSADSRLKPGTEVLKINGHSVRTVLEQLLTVSRADGSNTAKRIANLEIQGTEEYDAFDIYFPLLFPWADNQFGLEVKLPGQPKTVTLNVSGLTYEERLAPIKAAVANRRGGDEPVFEFRQLDPRTGYLRMPTWALYDSKWNWKAYLDDVFAQLDRTPSANLVIDVRENEGGLDVGNYIIGKLIAKNLEVEGFERLVRYRQVPDGLAPYLDTWDPSFKNWGETAIPRGDGFFRLKKYDDGPKVTIIEAAPRQFKGRVFVLVGPHNSSATFQFAQILQRNKLATLVGQPTGGNQRGITGGAFFFLRLPNSRIEVDVPLIGSYPTDERPDAGLQPDILVAPRITDIARGIDTELETVKARFRGPKFR